MRKLVNSYKSSVFLTYGHAKNGKIPTISCNCKTPVVIIYCLGTSIRTLYNTELQIYKISCNYIHYLCCNLHTTTVKIECKYWPTSLKILKSLGDWSAMVRNIPHQMVCLLHTVLGVIRTVMFVRFSQNQLKNVQKQQSRFSLRPNATQNTYNVKNFSK